MIQFKSLEQMINYYSVHRDELEQLANVQPDLYNRLKSYIKVSDTRSSYESGDATAQDVLASYGDAASYGLQMTPEYEKWLDNEISRENTVQQQSYETTMRDTSLLSSGAQLQQLGLSPSGVIQVGGVSSGVNSQAADTSMRSNSALRAQMKMNDYNNKMGLAKSLIGAAGQMASSGIYGAAIGAIKHSAQAVAAEAANSGLRALQSMRPAVRDQLMKDESWRYNNSHNELLK